MTALKFRFAREIRLPVRALVCRFAPAALGVLAFSSASLQAQPLAFPGAQGFGRFATGGRGGTVFHVTTLDDSGPGSFREAVSRPNRTIVFDVGGVIRLSRRVSVSPNVTIAGQTAPGGGITLYGNGVSFSGANNSITRHIRFRMGTRGDAGKDAVGIAGGHDMIFDHVSVSWGRDENFSISGPVTNITIQDCIIGQGLQPHSAGGLIQTAGGVSILRTLYIDNHTRNPKVKGVNQFVNNVVYNWGGGGCYILGDSESDSFANVMNNYFIAGPSSSAAVFSRGNLNFHIYADANHRDLNRNGVLDGEMIPKSDYTTVSWQESPYAYPQVSALDPGFAFVFVSRHAGASRPRDEVDRRLIAELMSFGKLGETISRETGPGELKNGPAPKDTDRDGMPDDWEIVAGLDPKNAEDRNHPAPDGGTRLEEYLNWMAGAHAVTARNEPIELDLSELTGAPPASNFNRRQETNCTVEANEGARVVRVTPKKDFTGRAYFYVNPDSAGISTKIELLVK